METKSKPKGKAEKPITREEFDALAVKVEEALKFGRGAYWHIYGPKSSPK